jgi:hypothetical protein
MMGRYSLTFLSCILVLLVVSSVNASIVSWNCADDGDGVISMNSKVWADNGNSDYQLNMSCTQNHGGAPGHIAGDFTTDTYLDPKVLIMESVTNDTTFAWTDYHITIGMPQQFSFVAGYFTGPAGWSITPSGPVYPGTIPNEGGTGWVGTIDFVNVSGAPIAIGADGDFGFKISFNGTVQYCTQQIPTPEPTTILLLGLGAMSVVRRRR